MSSKKLQASQIEPVASGIINRGIDVCRRTENAAVNFWWWLTVDQLEMKRMYPELTTYLKSLITNRNYEGKDASDVIQTITGVVQNFPYAREHFRIGTLIESLQIPR